MRSLTCQQAVQADLNAQLLEAECAAQHEAPQDAGLGPAGSVPAHPAGAVCAVLPAKVVHRAPGLHT